MGQWAAVGKGGLRVGGQEEGTGRGLPETLVSSEEKLCSERLCLDKGWKEGCLKCVKFMEKWRE